MLLFAILLWRVLLPTAPLHASGDAGQPGSFLRQGVGARPLALGGAFAAIADDASSIYWNPAGLAQLKKPELTATHLILFEDTNYDFVAAAHPLPTRPGSRIRGTLGLGWIRQSSGNFEKRSNPFDSPTEFSIQENAYQLSWGQSFSEIIPLGFPLALGLSLKGIHQKIDTASGSGFGVDLGILTRPHPRLSFGALIQNLARPKVTLLSRPTRFPLGLDLSSTYAHPFPQQKIRILLAARTSKYGEARWKPSGGLEIEWADKASLRAGHRPRGTSAGLGWRFGNYQLDYSTLLSELGLSHHASLILRFGKTQEELAAEIRRGIQQFNQDEARRLSESYALQADHFLKEGNFPQAIRHLEIATLWNPENPALSSRLERARKLMEQQVGKLKPTLQVLEKTLQEFPSPPKAPAEIPRAEKPIPISPERRKRAEKLYYQAVDAYLKADYPKAKGLLEETLEINPLSVGTRQLLEKIELVTEGLP